LTIEINQSPQAQSSPMDSCFPQILRRIPGECARRVGPGLARASASGGRSVSSFEQSIQLRLLALRQSLLDMERAGGPRGRVDEELAEIDAALLRFVGGRFGLCEACGRALGRQRLLAEPTARLCFPCMHAAP
jgi:hypothetical protein